MTMWPEDMEAQGLAIFAEAIDRGVMVFEPSHAVNHVRFYMLMRVDGRNQAWFKHRLTKQYLVMPAVRTEAALFKDPPDHSTRPVEFHHDD